MIRIIVLIAQILFAFLVFQDAKERKMFYWLWAAFVFFMPILGIILYFALRKPKSGGGDVTIYR
ncbi:MAG: PLDc N-terminal domain-containing protein [Bacteroidales bacterium]|nr:PLDc N-terminal domain-containing protein [Bacteroidales bacterium]